MKDPTALPLSLYQANADLQTRIGALIQDSGRQWLDYARRLVGDCVAEGNAGLQGVLLAQDWQRLAALPADAFWRQLQQRFGDQQATAQAAVAAQTAFANGLQEALGDWQRDTAAALDEAGLAYPALDPDWSLLFSWEPPQPAGAATGDFGETAAKTAGNTAAKKRPARKATAAKAPAKKVAAKRTATKKAAARKAAPKRAVARKATTKKTVAKKAGAKQATKAKRDRH